jgi:putative oxidoreductase
MSAHGAQKLFGWFAGPGLTHTGEFMVKLGWRQGRFFGTAAALGEAGSGLLVAIGLLYPYAPALMILMMLTAILTVHIGKGFFVATNGFELPMVYSAGALILALTGPGDYSVDRFLGLDWFYSPVNSWWAIGVAAAIAILNSLLRRPTPPPTAVR